MKTRQDVLNWATRQPELGPDKLDAMRIGVTALILGEDDKVLLQARGPDAGDANGCLEGFGGSLDASENLLEDGIMRELAEEVGLDCQFQIVEFLQCAHLQFQSRSGELRDWAIVTFVVRLLSGTPRVTEPGHTDGIGWFRLSDLVGWDRDSRRRVTIVDENSETVTREVGLSIWVPTVVTEYVKRFGLPG